MFTRILVPLDGSERAERALPVAARLARDTGGSLVLAQVLNAPAELLPYVVPGFEPSTLGADLQAASNYLTALTALPEIRDVPAEVEVHAGIAASMILSVAQMKGADLIVLSSHGRSTLRHWPLGSVAQRVARNAPAPVLLLRDDRPLARGAASPAPGALRALVPLDGSAAAEAALLPAARFVNVLSAPVPGLVQCVHIFDHLTPDGKVPQTAHAWAENYLRTTAQSLRAVLGNTSPRIAWSTVANADVAHALVTLAEHGEPASTSSAPGGSDVIVLTAHGRGGLQAWALGDVTERVLSGAQVAVLVVRPDVTQAS